MCNCENPDPLEMPEIDLVVCRKCEKLVGNETAQGAPEWLHSDDN